MKPKFFKVGESISKFYTSNFIVKDDDDVQSLTSKFNSSFFFSSVTIPGTGLWVKRDFMLRHGFYIEVPTKVIVKQTKHGIVPLVDRTRWDLHSCAFRDHTFLEEFIVKNQDWKTTTQYQTMKNLVARGGVAYGCRNIYEVDNYHKKISSYVTDIERHGIRVQGYNNPLSPYPDDILVSATSKGEFFLERNGTHRLTLARFFDFPTVPVFVIRFHPDFLHNEYYTHNRIHC